MWTTFAQLATAALVLANGPVKANSLHRRQAINGQLADSYDYVIVGGGQAGLAVAARLSEDSGRTVLVLEAGDTDDQIKNKIDTPDGTYFNPITGTSYDWQYSTVPEANTNNRTIFWPRGKILGGSSAMNAMFHVRPSKIEVDAWSSLLEGDGAKSWNWDSIYAGMKKSETFNPPTDDARQIAKIQWDANSHGTNGPIHSSFSSFQFAQYGQWIDGMSAAGIWNNPDPMSGTNWGGWTTPSFINPSNWTRSYSASGYIDPNDRPNLTILVNSTVTRILFASQNNPTATGVEFAESKDATKRTVNIKREVILSSGAIGSPHVLLVSGIGPKDVLQAAGVPVVADLPGVGHHLQDHLVNSVAWNTTADTAGSLYASGLRSPEFLAHVNAAVAYLNASYIFGGNSQAADFQKQVADQYSSSVSLVPSQDSTVIDGYRARYDVISRTVVPSQVGLVEHILSLMSAGSISIGVAMQHPFSQGRVYINSSSVFDKPIIEPNYLAHPSDIVMLRNGLKAARNLKHFAPFNTTLGNETSPGPNVNTDEEWDAWIRGTTWTQFHPGCTSAMLPKAQGGVVDTNLKVYGTNNIRVVDGSVFPFLFSAHLGAPTYGIAEQGASIIRAANSATFNIPFGPMGLFALIGVFLAL